MNPAKNDIIWFRFSNEFSASRKSENLLAKIQASHCRSFVINQGFNLLPHAIADITIELRAMGVPWTLHCWMNALAAAHELRLDTVIDQLLQDFLQVCPDDYSQQFVMECLPLLFSIFRYSKVCVSNNFISPSPPSLPRRAPTFLFSPICFIQFLWEDTQKQYVTLDLICLRLYNEKLLKSPKQKLRLFIF